MNKKQKVMIGLSVLLVSTLVVVGTLAFFTDNEKKANIFSVAGREGTTIGVDITLTETNWEPMKAQNLFPGDIVAKNPTINVVQGPVYGRMKITLEDSENDQRITDPTRTAKIMSMISGWNDEFVLDTERISSEPGVYYYELSQILLPGDSKTLFESVKVPRSYTKKEIAEIGNFVIVVEAQAIQVQNFTDARAAFAALNGEIGG